MSQQLIFTLMAASLGFVAAICFAFASTFTSSKKLAATSVTCIGYNRALVKAVVSQSAQYLTGSLLLLASFALQVAAALASEESYLIPYPKWLFVLGVALVGTVLASVLALLSCWLLYKYRTPRVEKELKSLTTRKQSS